MSFRKIFSLDFIDVFCSQTRIIFTGSESSEWQELYFVPLFCFLLYNLGDYIGKELATRLQWPKVNGRGQYILLMMAIVRISFIPLFMYSNVAPSNRSTEVKTNNKKTLVYSLKFIKLQFISKLYQQFNSRWYSILIGGTFVLLSYFLCQMDTLETLPLCLLQKQFRRSTNR